MTDPYKAVRDVWLKKLDELEKSLDNPNISRTGDEGLMKQWGALLVESSQAAFRDQKFGEDEWPPRYPGMSDPKINIAGALSDFNSGRANPKPNRFQDRPALVDQGLAGGLWGSITFWAGKDDVEYGTNKPYARLHNEGGETYIRVTEDAYQKGRDWLFDKKGAPKKGREGYVPKLWPALYRRFLRQNVAKRPFLGVTKETGENMIRATVEYFERGQGEQLGGGRSSAAG